MRLSERLMQRLQVELDAAPLLAALRQLRQALKQNSHPTKAFVESLARRPTVAVATLQHGADGVTITVKPARELAMFLKRALR